MLSITFRSASVMMSAVISCVSAGLSPTVSLNATKAFVSPAHATCNILVSITLYAVLLPPKRSCEPPNTSAIISSVIFVLRSVSNSSFAVFLCFICCALAFPPFFCISLCSSTGLVLKGFKLSNPFVLGLLLSFTLSVVLSFNGIKFLYPFSLPVKLLSVSLSVLLLSISLPLVVLSLSLSVVFIFSVCISLSGLLLSTFLLLVCFILSIWSF